MKHYVSNQNDLMRIIEKKRKDDGITNENLFSGIAHEATYYRWKSGVSNICFNDAIRLLDSLGMDFYIQE